MVHLTTLPRCERYKGTKTDVGVAEQASGKGLQHRDIDCSVALAAAWRASQRPQSQRTETKQKQPRGACAQTRVHTSWASLLPASPKMPVARKHRRMNSGSATSASNDSCPAEDAVAWKMITNHTSPGKETLTGEALLAREQAPPQSHHDSLSRLGSNGHASAPQLRLATGAPGQAAICRHQRTVIPGEK
jgi:hypothetical protein